ncbi:MAG: TolC family protein, partial [Magnetococcales bacterium]|nr:TolC family protein [Magnetococcales bacterium]
MTNDNNRLSASSRPTPRPCAVIDATRSRRPLLVLCLLCAFAPASAARAETILEAASLALRTNPDAMAALENQRAIRHQIDGARAGYFPTLDAAAGYGREWSDNTATRGLGYNGLTLPNGQSSLTLSQMLYDG